MSIHEAIERAEALLPGKPAADGELDPRWQAIIAVGEYVETDPQPVWKFTRKWGRHPQEDLRAAIATCLLEHLLEYHCAAYLPRVERLSTFDPLFADTFLMCSAFGQAQESRNAARLKRLAKRLRSAQVSRKAVCPGSDSTRAETVST